MWQLGQAIPHSGPKTQTIVQKLKKSKNQQTEIKIFKKSNIFSVFDRDGQKPRFFQTWVPVPTQVSNRITRVHFGSQ